MKNLLIVTLLFSFALISSCKNKKKIAQKEVTQITQEVKDVKYKTTDLVAKIDRSMCFGACPAYSMEIYGSGKVIYKGRKFVDNIGVFTGNTTSKKIDLLLAKAKEIGYQNFKDFYDNKLVSDLPSTETIIFINGKNKKVYARYGTPKELMEFHKYFEELFKDIKYTKVETEK